MNKTSKAKKSETSKKSEPETQKTAIGKMLLNSQTGGRTC